MEVNVHHAKTHLSRLIQQAENGEEVIIARDGKPAVKLVPVQPETPEPKYRELGRLKGKLNLPENWEEEWKLIDKELEELMNDEPLMSEAPPGMDRWGNPTKLLDSNALIWSVSEPGRLSSTAKQAIRDSENQIVVSLVSLWEITIKISKGGLPSLGRRFNICSTKSAHSGSNYSNYAPSICLPWAGSNAIIAIPSTACSSHKGSRSGCRWRPAIRTLANIQ